MSNFDLNKSIAVYISIVCRNIHSRKKRKAVAREYAEHIEDAMYRYSLSGFAEEQAFYKACQDLGAPENYSELL